MDAHKALSDIVKDEKGINDDERVADGISIAIVDRYIIEIIRVSKMYKFELRVMPKAKKQETPEKESAQITGIEEQVSKTIKDGNEEKQEINHYISIKETFKDDNVTYADARIKVKDKDYKYTVEKPNTRYQELWEKTGFYQEKTTQAKVRVQLWPEHLPYDHFKRKRAFLFC
ncbi:hypothetical protein HYU50_02125 [Candidatus Woesearchaeota archaeon]|nr:hypothetical protein [Candidatus Woesearchaeota archaeon]